MAEMVPVLSYAGFYASSFEEFLELAHDLGFRAVQVTPDQEPNLYSQLSTRRLEAIAKRRDELGLALYVHNVFYDINLVSLVPDVQALAFDITRKVLRIAQVLSARSVTVHLGYMFGGWRQDPVQRERFWVSAERAVVELSELSEQSEVPILLENGSYHLTTADRTGLAPLHLGITPSELHKLIDLSHHRLGVSLDINKAVHSGHAVTEFIASLRDDIVEVQLSSTNRLAELREVLAGLDADQRPFPVILEGGRIAAVQALNRLRSEYG